MKRKSIYYFIGLVIILSIIFLLFKCQQNSICSSFDIDDEGWKVVGDVKNALAIPDYHNTDGNPGGYLSATDETTGGVWYWSAPEKFLGSKKAAFNKKLQFDLKQSDLNNQFEAADVILESKDLTLVFKFSSHPNTTWTSFSVILSPEAGWKKNTIDGQPASKEDLTKVLSSLTSLKIRGEFITGPDVGSIDNVCLYLK
ncbi:MAG: Laminin B (Domain IV) [Bacteroidetes bacterium ADurb.Bin041]|jgi:hypothetical protein|nr:MAG: Laminin B (Domain IV) [Bacteroidetes bacterium ADurb.Bin041]